MPCNEVCNAVVTSSPPTATLWVGATGCWRLASARQVITDLGLNPVQGATGVPELFEPNPNRSAALDNLKRRCEMYARMGLNRVYATTGTSKKVTEEDYKAAPENIYDAGEVAKQFNMSLRIEFPSQFNLYLYLTDDSENDARGGASEYYAHAGLLSFPVRPEQA
jgi:hypothetical protein